MSHAAITLVFLLFAIIMFIWEKLPLGVTSMIVCIGLIITGVLDWQTAFSGFIDSKEWQTKSEEWLHILLSRKDSLSSQLW